VKGHLERGWVKHRLIRDFALGEKTGVELAGGLGDSSFEASLAPIGSPSPFPTTTSFAFLGIAFPLSSVISHLPGIP
jgi:hypothetical protein